MIKTDVVVLVPIFNDSLNKETIQKLKKNNSDKLIDLVLKDIEPDIHFNFRKNLEYIKLDDTLFMYNSEIKLPTSSYLFFDNQSNLGALQLWIKDVEINCDVIANKVENNEFAVLEEEKIMTMREYVAKLGLTICGDLRCFFNQELNTDINNIKNLLYGGLTQRMEMTQEDYDKLEEVNISPFRDWPYWIGRKCIIQQNKSHSILDNSNEWLIYVASIAVMQYACVYQVNKRIEEELSYKHSIDTKRSLKIIEEFGMANNLFNCNMFLHTNCRNLLLQLREKWETNERFELYKSNKEILFDIAELRDDIQNDKENDVLFVAAIVFGIFGILDLFADAMSPGTIRDWVVYLPSALTAFWACFMCIKIRNKHK